MFNTKRTGTVISRQYTQRDCPFQSTHRHITIIETPVFLALPAHMSMQAAQVTCWYRASETVILPPPPPFSLTCTSMRVAPAGPLAGPLEGLPSVSASFPLPPTPPSTPPYLHFHASSTSRAPGGPPGGTAICLRQLPPLPPPHPPPPPPPHLHFHASGTSRTPGGPPGGTAVCLGQLPLQTLHLALLRRLQAGQDLGGSQSPQ